MLFQTLYFILFLCVVLTVSSFLTAYMNVYFLILISIFFYASFGLINLPIFLIFILLGVSTYYIVSLKKYLVFLVLMSLFPLLYFKSKIFYLNILHFETSNTAILPLGISFITFTLISMIVDLSKQKSKKYHPLDISLYICFFPHLIAGPILRSGEMIPQLKTISVRWQNIKYNLPLFATGMVKKVLIADQIHSYTQPIFAAPQAYNSNDLIVAAVGFSIQIYCDFSAYSDMAIATAGMFNIYFPENFHSPYLSFSLTEIWKRWHMTLGFWLRDYVFIPLVRRCHGTLRYLPIFLTMLISGLWHGASWNFILWGGLQGGIMIFESATGYNRFMAKGRYVKKIGILLNFLLWTLLLILFRSPTIHSAMDYYVAMGVIRAQQLTPQNLFIIILMSVVIAFHCYDNIDFIRKKAEKIPAILSVPILISIMLGCSIVAAQRPESFYYFDF